MSEHVTNWLQAYYDGELSGRRLHLVEHHLEACEDCQAELDALADLSMLLQADSQPESELSAEQFTQQVLLLLPRDQEKAPWHVAALKVVWRYTPLLLGVLWVLLQSLMLTYALLSTANVISVPFVASPVGCVNHALGAQNLVAFVRCSVAWVVQQLWMWSPSLLLVSWLAFWWSDHTRHQNRYEYQSQ